MVYFRGSSVVPVIITVLFVVVAAVVAVFFLWPAPEPRILITNVSPIPRNGERVLAEKFIELKWEAVYERPRQGLMAEVFVGEDRNSLVKLAQDVEGTLTSQSEGIFSFVFRYPVEPHSQYWWKVRVYNQNGKSVESEVWTFVLMNQYPEKPELIPPSQNSANVALRDLVLKWKASDLDNDELTYDVYFGREPRLDERDLLLKGTKDTEIDISTLKKLDYSTKYYWKVVAKDPYGGESVSKTDSFTTQIRAELPALSPVMPVNGMTGFNADIASLSWKTSLPLDYYPDGLFFDVYIAEGQSRASLVGTTNKTEMVVPSIKGHTSYNWYIVVRDASGKEKKSDQWTFTTANRAPVIDIQYPDLTTSSTSVPVSWTVIDRDGDEITSEVFFGEVNETPVRIASGKMTSIFLSGLNIGKQYMLKVVSKDGRGAQTEKEILLTPGNSTPSVVLSRPGTDGTVEPTMVTFEWSGSDGDGDKLTYQLHINSPGQRQVFENIDIERFTVRDLQEEREYSWYVIASDEKGAFARSPERVFKTGKKSLEVVNLLLPEHEASELPLRNIEFTWKIDQEPENAQYIFTLSKDPKMEEIVIQRTVKEKALKVNQELQSNTRYYWSVDLLVGEEVRTGEVRTFKTFNNPPEIPTARSPVDGAVDVSTDRLTLVWDASDIDGAVAGSIVHFRINGGEEKVLNTSSNSVMVDRLLPGREYRWWVEIIDDGGKKNKSPEWIFTTGNQSPAVTFTLPSGTLLEGVTAPLQFTWELDDPEGENLSVSVFLNETGMEIATPVVSGNNLLSYRVERIEEGRDYTLTVVATDPGGKEGKASIAFKSRYSQITYIYPTSGGRYSVDRNFEWSHAGASDGYIFRLYDGDFNPLVRERTTEVNYRPEITLETGKLYYWAVSVVDGDREYAGFPVGFFAGSGNSVTLLSPQNNSVVETSGVTLSWEVQGELNNISRTELFFGEAGKLTPIIIGPNSRSYTTGSLGGGKSYEWYVQLTDVSGNTSKSEIRRFEVLLEATNNPPVIALSAPQDGEVVDQSSVELRWSASDIDGDRLSFSLYFGKNNDLLLMGEGITNSSFTVTNLEPGNSYSWYVRVSDGRITLDSPIRRFTAVQRVVTIDTPSPSDGSEEIGIKPILSWRMQGATGGEFRIYLGTSRSFLPMVGTSSSSTFTYTGELEKETTYFWKVELWDGSNLVSTSPVWQFSTESWPVHVSDTSTVAVYVNGTLNVITMDNTSGIVSVIKNPYQYQGKVSPVINGDLIYMVDDTGRLVTLRVSGNTIETVSSLNTGTSPETLVLAGGYLWLLDTKSAAVVLRISLDNRGVPTRSESVFRDWTTPVDMFVSEDLSRIYLADALSGIKVLERSGTSYVDVSSRFTVSLSGYARSVVVVQNLVFSGEAGIDGGLKMIDLSRSIRSNLGKYYIVLKLLVSNNIVFAITDKGVSIIDVTSTSQPVILRDIEISQVDEIRVSGRLLAIRAGNRLLIYDVLSAGNPVLLNEYN